MAKRAHPGCARSRAMGQGRGCRSGGARLRIRVGLPRGAGIEPGGDHGPEKSRRGQEGQPEDQRHDSLSLGFLPGRGWTRISFPTCARDGRRADRIPDCEAPIGPRLRGAEGAAQMGAVYFNSKVAPRLWKDESGPLDLAETLRRFPQWTYLPILPDRENTLRDCLREGVGQKLWAVAIGDAETNVYRRLIETTEEFDGLSNLFDGSASLVKGDLLDLIREELSPEDRPTDENEQNSGSEQPQTETGTEQSGEQGTLIPRPAKRHARVRLSVRDLSVAKTSNLQPYLFRVLQEQDAGAEVSVTIEVSSDAGISEEALNQRIVEGFSQLGIPVEWQEE